MILIQPTNKYYPTAKRAFIPSTFDEQICQALVGAEMQGKIIKEECEMIMYLRKQEWRLHFYTN